MTSLMTIKDLTLGAWAEASRVRAPEIDADHLFLAVLGAGGAPARLLAAHGVSLASARRAVRVHEAGQLRALGLEADGVQPDPRSAEMLRSGTVDRMGLAARGERIFDALPRVWTQMDLLRACLSEPSGLVAGIVDTAGADAQVVAEASHDQCWARPEREIDADPVSLPAAIEAETGGQASALRTARFVSAPTRDVVSLVRQPRRAMAWLGVPGSDVAEDGSIHVPSPGSALASRWAVEELACAPPVVATVLWRGHRGGRLARFVVVSLEPEPGGTHVQLDVGLIGRPRGIGARFARAASRLAVGEMLQRLTWAGAEFAD